jgi:DNA-binding transcriptional LysR family regulator
MATLSQLQAFATLARVLHFGRAAASLGIAQPTLSKEIRRLEREVGEPLFHRSAGGSTLSQVGERLLTPATVVLDRMREFETAVAEVRRESRRAVTIAASPSVVNSFLGEALRRIEDEHPGLSITALEVETGRVLRAVEDGAADVGLGHLVGEPQQAHKRRLASDEMRVLIHRSLVPQSIQEIRLDQLGRLPLLMWQREQSPIYFDFLMDACQQRGLEPVLLTATSRISGAWSFFLDDARAFAIVPVDFAERAATEVLTALALAPPLHLPLEVVWRTPTPEVKRVLGVLAEVAQGRPGA